MNYEMSSKTHAIVIGGSMAGLTAARILTDHYDHVTVFERDVLPTGAEFRKGVPQGRHPHAILKRGEMILEQLFPGLVEQLIEAGATTVNMGADSLWFAGGWRPRYTSKINTTACSRPLLEETVRARLMANPKIRFVQECEVIGLEANAAGTHIAGIRVRGRNGSQLDNTEEALLTADLVVDASGRDSRAPQWLESLGYTPPKETVVDGKPTYASRIYERPADSKDDWKIFYMQPIAPDAKRGGIALPVEGGKQWQFTLIGMAGDYSATDEEGFMEFARSLPDPKMYEILQEYKPITPIVGYRRAENRMRHYEQMPRFLENFVVTGDAACAFNPVYGQGMSTASIDALELDQCIRRFRAGETEGMSLAEHFQKQLAQVVALPWQMATGEDMRWFPTEQTGEIDQEMMLMGCYMEQVMRATTVNPNVLEAFYHVMHMLETPAIFFRPDLVLQVVNEMVTA